MPTILREKDLKKKKKKDPNRSKIYYANKGWKTLRNSYIMSHPLCEMCLKEGKITPAEHVHHRTPFLSGATHAERLHLLLDQDNLMSLCRKCHMEIHKTL